MFLSRVHFVERTAEVLANLQHGTVVIELITIVGCAEYGYKFLVGKELIAILHHLVTTNYQIQFMLLKEL